MELIQQWGTSLSDAFAQGGLGVEILLFLPKLLLAIIIFIAGWVVGSVLGDIVEKVVKALKFDIALEHAGAKSVIHKAGFNLNSGMFFGAIVKWFVIIGFLVAALDVFQLTAVTLFLTDVVLGYIPQVVVAALILIVAAFLADFVQKVTSGGARALDSKSSAMVGSIARWAIWIFAILAAVAQLGIATQMLNILFMGIVFMLALAGGLAFGLGGRDAAARYIEKVRDDVTTRN